MLYLLAIIRRQTRRYFAGKRQEDDGEGMQPEEDDEKQWEAQESHAILKFLGRKKWKTEVWGLSERENGGELVKGEENGGCNLKKEGGGVYD